MPDGSEFVFEENKNTEPTYSDMLAQKSDQGTDISSVSDNNVTQKHSPSKIIYQKIMKDIHFRLSLQKVRLAKPLLTTRLKNISLVFGIYLD